MDIVLTILIGLALQTVNILADFEHTCTYSDYFGARARNGQMTRCGTALLRMLDMKCGGLTFLGSGQSFISIKKKRSITLDSNQANSYLSRRSRRSAEQGIVCECCANTCTLAELEQYCMPSRKRRSLRDVITGQEVQKESKLTQELVDKVYELIDAGLVGDEVITPDVSEKLHQLEQNKQQNIARKQQQQSVTDQSKTAESSNIDITQQTPDDPTATNSELIVNTLKASHLKRHHGHRGHHRRQHAAGAK